METESVKSGASEHSHSHHSRTSQKHHRTHSSKSHHRQHSHRSTRYFNIFKKKCNLIKIIFHEFFININILLKDKS